MCSWSSTKEGLQMLSALYLNPSKVGGKELSNIDQISWSCEMIFVKTFLHCGSYKKLKKHNNHLGDFKACVYKHKNFMINTLCFLACG